MRRCLALAALAVAGCRGGAFRGPLSLLEVADLSGRMPRIGVLASGGEARAALLESARFRVALPPRPLLTFGAGVAYAGGGEAPGWYHLTVRAGGRVLSAQKLNPRALRGFHDVSLPLEGLGRGLPQGRDRPRGPLRAA